jgi:hypothetical protein
MRTPDDIRNRMADYEKALAAARRGDYMVAKDDGSPCEVITEYTIARSMSAIAELDWVLRG